jgi:hypothetical protein
MIPVCWISGMTAQTLLAMNVSEQKIKMGLWEAETINLFIFLRFFANVLAFIVIESKDVASAPQYFG